MCIYVFPCILQQHGRCPSLQPGKLPFQISGRVSLNRTAQNKLFIRLCYVCLIYLARLTTKTAHHSLWPFKEKNHGRYMPESQSQGDYIKIDYAHFELWVSFHFNTGIRNLYSPFGRMSNFFLVSLKNFSVFRSGIFLTNVCSTALVTKNSGIKISVYY